ncbi:MAG: hypothetical protein AABZ16_10460, partial [candidate division NC10 bacterium]
MKTDRWPGSGGLPGWGSAGLVFLAFLLFAPSVMAAAGEAAPADYRGFFGGNSRLVIWIVAQVHLMF